VDIPINSIMGYIGLALLVFGVFMVLAGLDIISVQQVTVKKGRRTWIMGIVFALIGIGLLLPEFRTTTPTTGIPETPFQPAIPSEASDTILAPTTVSGQENSLDYTSERSIKFSIPSETLWRQTEDSYTIIDSPSSETIAWSDEIVSGDFVLTAEVTHTGPPGQIVAMFIVYGDGIGFSNGCLIFHYGDGWAGILKHTIYQQGENWLVVNKGDFNVNETKRVITIEITGRKASLYSNGQKVASTFLPSEINSSGRVGIVQDYEMAVGTTYSNIRIKTLVKSE